MRCYPYKCIFINLESTTKYYEQDCHYGVKNFVVAIFVQKMEVKNE